MFGKLFRPIVGGNAKGVALAEPAALVIARRERVLGDKKWFVAKSWLGGAPKLGSQSWPRSRNDQPMHFLAQLDLSEIAAAGRGQTALPTKGALAFFVGSGDHLHGQIVHVTSPGESATAVPGDLGRVEDIGGDPIVNMQNEYGPNCFPFWPVEFRELPATPRISVDDEEAIERADLQQTEAIARLYQRRTYNFRAAYEAQQSALGDVPLFWHSALMFAERVPKMREQVAAQLKRGEGYVETSIARLDALNKGLPAPAGQGSFGDPEKERANSESWLAIGRKAVAESAAHRAAIEAYVAKVNTVVKATDPWQLISPEDVVRLDQLFKEAQSSALKSFSRYILPRDWRDYATDTIKLMAAGPEIATARLPAAWRAIVNTGYRLPIGPPHVLFGLGANIQGNEMFERPEMRMVLQLGFDDMMYWPFGDNGAYQFWMSEASLRAGDFASAQVTFEAH